MVNVDNGEQQDNFRKNNTILIQNKQILTS